MLGMPGMGLSEVETTQVKGYRWLCWFIIGAV
jgi:hypothetical protein